MNQGSVSTVDMSFILTQMAKTNEMVMRLTENDEWELNSSWKQKSEAFKDARMESGIGEILLQNILCYDVAKYTRPKS